MEDNTKIKTKLKTVETEHSEAEKIVKRKKEIVKK